VQGDTSDFPRLIGAMEEHGVEAVLQKQRGRASPQE
jgi:hypothetical protein